MSEIPDSSPETPAPPVSRRPALRSFLTLIATTRNFLLALAAVLVLSIAYYFVIALPAHNRGLLELEREKFHAAQAGKETEAQEKQLKDDLARIDVEHKEKMLEICTEGADAAYWSYVKLNGTEVPGKKGTYTAPGYVWDSASRRKKEAFEECHRRWGKSES